MRDLADLTASLDSHVSKIARTHANSGSFLYGAVGAGEAMHNPLSVAGAIVESIEFW